MNTPSFLHSLMEAAAAPYRAAGQFPWRFAKGKLQGDPIFTVLLERALIPTQTRVLDLGCGKGLLASWLTVARSSFESGRWPQGWPEPPKLASYRGIEQADRDVVRAKQALGERGDILLGDIRTADFGQADVAVLLDVLHYMDYPAQNDVLARLYESLLPDGVLLLRVGDAGGGLRFKISNWVDHLVCLCRGIPPSAFFCRSSPEWQAELVRSGFSVDQIPLSQGATFSNVLLIARPGKKDGGAVTVKG